MTHPNEPDSSRDGDVPDGEAPSDVRGPPTVPIVAVGGSAGGLEAFTRFLKDLPGDTGMAFVIIQHLSPDRPSPLAALLSRSTPMPVVEGADGMLVEANHVYVIPPGAEMALREGHLTVKPRSRERVPHRPVDVFFQSLAEHQPGGIGIVLSGADSDGTLGLRAIKASGGMTFAQDESARVFGMPRSGIASGYVDLVLPPEKMAKEIVRLAAMPEVLRTLKSSPPPPAPEEHARTKDDEEGFREILRLLRIVTGVDFTHYKQTTVRRRILRRMALGNVSDVHEFVRLLREAPGDLSALHDDILINVTTFFRDAEVFDALARQAFPRLIRDRHPDDPIRVWVPGCATGEEAYSIAMALIEAIGHPSGRPPLQIFGTDVSSLSIDRARTGIYAESIVADVSNERLRRFFVKVDRGYQISKAVRDFCIFAKHDLTRDPPFSKLDLISCRNLLIYLDSELQNRIIPLLHYALKPGGYLLLGTSETVGEHGDLFGTVDARNKLYARGGGFAKEGSAPPPQRRLSERHDAPRARDEVGPGFDAEKEADRILIDTYAPPAVIVNGKLEILHFRGQTAPYLQPASGKATFHLLTMAREGLVADLSSALRRAREERVPVKVEDLRVLVEGSTRELDLEVIPLGAAPSVEAFLVLFQPKEKRAARAPDDAAEGRAGAPREPSDEVAELRRELTRVRRERDSMRQQLQSVIDDEGAYNEELQSANEEVLSSNEELQSVNEELETAKEELQSTNEELSTVNDELQGRNVTLNELNDDLFNLLASVAIPIVMLGADLRIRRFTPVAQSLFSLIGTDIGRPISDINIRVDIPDLEQLCAQAIDTMAVVGREVQGRDGHWYSLRVQPYRTRDNKIDGAVILLFDIDAARRALLSVEDARDYAEAVVATVREPLMVLDGDGTFRVRSVNQAFRQAFQVSSAEICGVVLDDSQMAAWRIPNLRRVLEEVRTNGLVEDFELVHDLPRIGKRTLLLNARRIERKNPADRLVLLAIEDVTERKRIARELQERVEEAEALLASDRRKDDFLAMLAHELRNPMTPIVNAVGLIRNRGKESEPFARELGIIARQVQRLVRIIDDLLDVARITRGVVELRKERMDLAAIVHASVESVRPLAETRHHRLRVTLPEQPVRVEVDPVRMEQVFTNLLNNAIKYTEPGGQIDVVCERADTRIAVRVRDNGVGIERDMLAHVFDLFTQEQGPIARTGGGLGIGLTIVRQLVEMHGGYVEVRSEGRGRGSEFSVYLPSLLSAEKDSGAARALGAEIGTPAASPGKGCRTLIVEDNEDVLDTLLLLLRDWGCEVRGARDGAAALEAVNSFAPQIVLLDLGLPGMDGYEVARRLRSTPATRDARLIAMSGYGQAKDKRLSQEAGFDQHLVKPLDPDRLKQIVVGEEMR